MRLQHRLAFLSLVRRVCACVDSYLQGDSQISHLFNARITYNSPLFSSLSLPFLIQSPIMQLFVKGLDGRTFTVDAMGAQSVAEVKCLVQQAKGRSFSSILAPSFPALLPLPLTICVCATCVRAYVRTCVRVYTHTHTRAYLRIGAF